MLSENDRSFISKLNDKSTEDFQRLKQKIERQNKDLQKQISDLSKALLDTFESLGLEKNDFTRGSIPAHFQKLAQGEIVTDFTAAWKKDITTAKFYGAKLEITKKDAIDGIRNQIEDVFIHTKKAILKIDFNKNIIKNLTPLSVLNAIHKELELLKKEQHILLISEFNNIISEAIKDQPTPFIYERLGERYQEYFIDEFQDTSYLQWNNLVPLIDSALSGTNNEGKQGGLVIVGDAKQAIYRWRGGKAEQFIALSNTENPFSTEDKLVENLPRNYRSYSEVIEFNNSFFTFLSNDFSDSMHKNLYVEGNHQEVNSKKGGFVNISFIEAKGVDEENEAYAERTYEIVEELQQKGFDLSEICILTRRQKEGVSIANYLTEKGIDIISSETLLINNSKEVRCIINLLKLALQPEDKILRVQLLDYLITRFEIEDKAGFLFHQVNAGLQEFEGYLEKEGLDFSFEYLMILPIYESVEYIIRSFKLNLEVSAYLQFFLDIVFDYSQKNVEGVIGFLSYWEDRKDKLSIVAPKGRSAVQIMTIHKSKGLEFPCVIYPYANVDIYRELEPKTWYPVDEDEYEGFGEVFLNYNKKLADQGIVGERLVQYREAQLELDAINVLYVALTRAEEQLYIISKRDINAKGESNPNKFSGKLINYLSNKGQWNDAVLNYDFGINKRYSKPASETEISDNTMLLKQMINTPKESHSISIITNTGKLWDTHQQEAKEKGILLHDILSRIKTKEDVEIIIEEFYNNGEIQEVQKPIVLKEIEKIIKHPDIEKYFEYDLEILNEKDILSEGRLYRPDRIVIDHEKKATVIDYKTGLYELKHEEQVYQYGIVLEKLGYTVEHKILLYINDSLNIKYV